MLAHVTALTLLAASPQAADLVLEVSRGDRLVIEDLSGDVSVTGWDRDVVEIEDDDDAGMRADRSGGAVRVRGRRSRASVDARIRVPTWMDVVMSAPSLDVTVRGVAGDLDIRTVRGDVGIRDASGSVGVRSVVGDISVTDASGTVSVSSQSGDVSIARATGNVSAHSGDGDLDLRGMAASSITAETQDGDLGFEGRFLPGGSYEFSVHDGDIRLALPDGTSADVTVATFSGEFETEFPVVIQQFSGGGEFEFVMGGGGARVRIEVFDGEIELLRR